MALLVTVVATIAVALAAWIFARALVRQDDHRDQAERRGQKLRVDEERNRRADLAEAMFRTIVRRAALSDGGTTCIRWTIKSYGSKA